MFLPTQPQPLTQALPQAPALPQRPSNPPPRPAAPQPRYDAAAAHPAVNTALSSLSPSLLQDLQRFHPSSPQRELLEVLAACIRHTQALALDLDGPHGRFTLSVFPLDSMMHCALALDELLDGGLADLQVLQVRPASLQPPAQALLQALNGQPGYLPLRPMLWLTALYGNRESLLPELAGKAAYRVSPSLVLDGLDVPGAMAACITQLRRQTSNLAEVARWQDIGAARAMRLLNALYLQAGLIISRSHPAATNEGWAGYPGA